MTDPISRLDEFRSQSPGVPMKSAAEVRQRGDQIRRRHRAVVAGVTAVAVAALVAPVFALASGPDRDISPAPQPSAPTSTSTPSASPTSTRPARPTGPLTAANLLDTADVAGLAEAGIDITGDQASSGDPQASVNPCQTSGYADLGATTVLVRDFGFAASDGGDGAADTYLSETVSEYASPEEARAAVAAVDSWHRRCAPTGSTFLDYQPPAKIKDGGTQVIRVNYSPSTASPQSQYDTSGKDLTWHLTTGIVLTGARVAVVTHLDLDAHKTSSSDLVPRALPAAADRLSNGGGTGGSSDASTGPPSSTPTTTVLSDANLPTAGDLPDLDRQPVGWTAYTPSPDVPTLACQKEWLTALHPAEKVAADFRADSDTSMVGQVHVAVLEFPDVNAAGAAYNKVMEWEEICPASKLGEKPSVTAVPRDVGRDIKLGLDRAARSQDTYAASEIPGEHDLAWFETELVAQKGTRLILVGHGELAGPCPPSTGDQSDPCYQPDTPDTWPGRILAIEKAAVRAGLE